MTVPDYVTEGGNISDGKTPKKDVTPFNVHNCVVSIFKLKNIS